MTSSIFSFALSGSSISMLLLLAKATLILVAALGITLSMQRASAGARHLVWLVTLATLLLVPALTAWAPIQLRVLPPTVDAKVRAPVVNSAEPSSPTSKFDKAPPTTPAATDAELSAARSVEQEIASSPVLSGLSILLLVWAVVVVAIGASLGYAAMMVKRIVNRARPLDTEDWRTPLWEVSDRLELEEPPRLLRSEDAKMPFACGLLTPTIVLPAESDRWTLDRRRAVLLHELAHVRRRDLVGHTVGRFACALYWFHPLVWTAAKRLRSESERACDDLALNCGARASDYAEHLLDIVTGVRHHATPAVALAMARRKEFEGRMLAILDPELRRGAPGRKQTVGLVGGLVVLSLVVGAAVPVARAADGSVRPAALAASGSVKSADADSFRDEEMSQSVRTVERQRTEQRTKTETTIVLRSRGRDELGSVVGSTVGSKVGVTVGKEIGAVAGAAAAAAVRAAAPSIESLTAAIREGAVKQGRSDERPALLANVLKTDTSASLRRVAAWGLAQFADADVASEALASALKTDRDVAVREMAAWALADARRTTAVTEALTTALRRDASPKVRASAAWALGNIGDRDAVDELAAALSDTSRGVRIRSAWAIGNAEPKQAPKALVGLLSDKEIEVRQVAAWALFNIQDPDAVPALDSALRRETDKETQRAIIRALAATGEKSVEAIKRLLDSKDPEVRSMAIRALASGGGGGGPWPWPWPDPRPHP